MTLEGGGGRGVNPQRHNDVNFSSNSLDKLPKSDIARANYKYSRSSSDKLLD